MMQAGEIRDIVDSYEVGGPLNLRLHAAQMLPGLVLVEAVMESIDAKEPAAKRPVTIHGRVEIAVGAEEFVVRRAVEGLVRKMWESELNVWLRFKGDRVNEPLFGRRGLPRRTI